MDQTNDQNTEKDFNPTQKPTHANDVNNQKNDAKNEKGKTDADAHLMPNDQNSQKPHTAKEESKEEENMLQDMPSNDSTDNSDFFMDYPSVSSVLADNGLQFPANPVRLAELQTLASIMAEPVHNNALLMVDKTEDALPMLALFESLYQLIGGKKVPFALMHYNNFISSPESVSFSEDLTKAKGLLNHLIEDVQNRVCIPVLTDLMPFVESDELMDEVDALLSQPKSVICIITKENAEELQKIIDEEKEFQRSFASTNIIMPKTAFSSFTRMNIQPLSLKETQAILKNYTDQVLKPNGIFSKRAMKSILYQGYKTFPASNNLIEIQKVFRVLSVSQKANDIHTISPNEIYAFFKNVPSKTASRSNPILECEFLLNQKVLGQTEAIHQVAELVQAKEFSLTDEKQPTVMGFFGPSGVGKTATAEALGPILSGRESVLINMSEFQEPHSISKLISSPPGYVGSEHPGLLHKTIAQNPKAVFILDEFEKANETVHKLFLGIFDKGLEHDTAAGTVDLSQATFILTSNAGIKEAAGLGFGENSGKVSYVADEKEIEHAFAPEFMGRLQSRVLFKPLSEKTLSQIIDLTLAPAQQKLKERFNTSLLLANSAREQLIREGANPRYGARPLKNLIKTKILTPLTIQLHKHKLNTNTSIQVTFHPDSAQYTFEPMAHCIQKQKQNFPKKDGKTRE